MLARRSLSATGERSRSKAGSIAGALAGCAGWGSAGASCFASRPASGWSARSSACPAASLPRGGRLRATSRAGRSSGALATVELLLERGHGVSVDLFGERVSDPAVADQVLEDYLALVAALPPPPADVWLSVDLSHLALGAGAAAAADRLAAIADALPVGRRVQVG